MGYVLSESALSKVIAKLADDYRLWAPVLKVGEGRFTDTDVVRYEFVTSLDQIELDTRSDYSFKEILQPLSQTLFYFTEGQVTTAPQDDREALVFLRACDLHALRRVDQMYLDNGPAKDWFYNRIRDKVKFVLLGCEHEFDNCFCVSMGSNVAPEGSYLFSLDRDGEGNFRCDVPDASVAELFDQTCAQKAEVVPAHVTQNEIKVTIPEEVPNSIYKNSALWDEYTARCIKCGRCNVVCPTCTCYTMQDVFYTDNGKVGERRRVVASCMIDGYTNVAGGGQYRRTGGERMRFKVLHKVYDFRKRFGYDMCVGCGRCSTVCPEYISFSTLINKVNAACEAEAAEGTVTQNA